MVMILAPILILVVVVLSMSMRMMDNTDPIRVRVDPAVKRRR